MEIDLGLVTQLIFLCGIELLDNFLFIPLLVGQKSNCEVIGSNVLTDRLSD